MDRTLTLLPLLLLIACGGDDPAGPVAAPPVTHHEISIEMSSITALEDCENDPGNPGDFRWRLVVRKKDELGNWLLVGDTGTQLTQAFDGDTIGANSEPIRFVMPRGPGEQFQVEYWLYEDDGNGNTEIDNHSWVTHTYDRNPNAEWQPGSTDWDGYNAGSDKSYGLCKFTVWDTRDGCQGFARYYVEWAPFDPDA